MVIDLLREIFPPDQPPNNFTELMGMKVKQAREEAGLSQAELAKRMYTRQATISDIERGKKWARSVDLIYFSSILEKPILFFIPEKYKQRAHQEITDPLIQELITTAKKLPKQDLERLIIQSKALIDK